MTEGLANNVVMAVTLDVAPADSVIFVASTAGMVPGTTYRAQCDGELIPVVRASSTSMSVVGGAFGRGSEGTTAAKHLAGSKVALVVSNAGVLQLISEQPGNSLVLAATAGTDLSGHRVVVRQPGDTVVYADHNDATHRTLPLGLTLGAALAGGAVNVLMLGEVVELTWAWTAGQPLYVGAGGLLTQSYPGSPAVWTRLVGTAMGATSIYLDPTPAITLAA